MKDWLPKTCEAMVVSQMKQNILEKDQSTRLGVSLVTGWRSTSSHSKPSLAGASSLVAMLSSTSWTS